MVEQNRYHRVSEAAKGNQDLNGDGDAIDMVLQRSARRRLPEHHHGDPQHGDAPGGGVRRRTGRVRAFVCEEAEQGIDFNSDGDTDDFVVRYFELPELSTDGPRGRQGTKSVAPWRSGVLAPATRPGRLTEPQRAGEPDEVRDRARVRRRPRVEHLFLDEAPEDEVAAGFEPTPKRREPRAFSHTDGPKSCARVPADAEGIVESLLLIGDGTRLANASRGTPPLLRVPWWTKDREIVPGLEGANARRRVGEGSAEVTHEEDDRGRGPAPREVVPPARCPHGQVEGRVVDVKGRRQAVRQAPP